MHVAKMSVAGAGLNKPISDLTTLLKAITKKQPQLGEVPQCGCFFTPNLDRMCDQQYNLFCDTCVAK